MYVVYFENDYEVNLWRMKNMWPSKDNIKGGIVQIVIVSRNVETTVCENQNIWKWICSKIMLDRERNRMQNHVQIRIIEIP